MVADTAEKVSLAEREADRVVMAVDEACTNIVRHAYTARTSSKTSELFDTESSLEIRISATSNYLDVQVRDRGIGSSITWHKAIGTIGEYLELKNPHGLGTYIMHKFMDEVSTDFPDDRGCLVRMRKYI